MTQSAGTSCCPFASYPFLLSEFSQSPQLFLSPPSLLLSSLFLFLLSLASLLSSSLLWLLFLLVLFFFLEQVSQCGAQTHLWELVEILLGDPVAGR